MSPKSGAKFGAGVVRNFAPRSAPKDRHWTDRGIARVTQWHHTGIALVLHWYCTVSHRYYAGNALVRTGVEEGALLVLHWYDAGITRALNCIFRRRRRALRATAESVPLYPGEGGASLQS